MIRWIIFLPIRIIGHIFLAIGAMLESRNAARIEQAKQEQRIAKEQNARIEREKRERFKLEKQAAADRERMDRKRKAAEKENERQAEKRKLKQFQIEQAKTDVVHYEQQKKNCSNCITNLKNSMKTLEPINRKRLILEN